MKPSANLTTPWTKMYCELVGEWPEFNNFCPNFDDTRCFSSFWRSDEQFDNLLTHSWTNVALMLFSDRAVDLRITLFGIMGFSKKQYLIRPSSGLTQISVSNVGRRLLENISELSPLNLRKLTRQDIAFTISLTVLSGSVSPDFRSSTSAAWSKMKFSCI